LLIKSNFRLSPEAEPSWFLPHPERQNLSLRRSLRRSYQMWVRRDNTCDHVQQSRPENVDARHGDRSGSSATGPRGDSSSAISPRSKGNCSGCNPWMAPSAALAPAAPGPPADRVCLLIKGLSDFNCSAQRFEPAGIVTETVSGASGVSGRISTWLRSATADIASCPRSSSTRSGSISASP